MGGGDSEQLRANTGRVAKATGDGLRQRLWPGYGPRSGPVPQGSSGVWMVWVQGQGVVCLNVCLLCIMCGVCVYARQAVGFPGPEHTHTQDQHKQQGLGQSQPWIDLAQGREGAIRSQTGGCHMWGHVPLPGDGMPLRTVPTWEASSLPGKNTHVHTHTSESTPTNVAVTLAAT